jgi:hypothetical protein
VVFLFSLLPLYWLSALGLGVFAYALVRYVDSLGHSLAIIEIISVIASLQWLAAPLLAYGFGNIEPKYRMYVPQEEYMAFAVPGVLMLILGMELAKGRSNFAELVMRLKSRMQSSKQQAYLLICIGLVAGVVSPRVPPSLAFVFFFAAQLQFVGVLYLILSNDRRKWLVAGAVWSLTAVTSLDQGMFHNLILWSAFIFSFVCLDKRFSTITKWIMIVSGLVLLVLLQSIKAEYREMVLKQSYSGSKAALAANLMITQPGVGKSDTLLERASFTNARFNQGWIISAILSYVPRMQPHEGCETIVRAFTNTLVPRFLVEKKAVWVSEKFQRYTGLKVGKTTSMGISVLGEAYINFGKAGAFVFMFVWGVFNGLIFRGLIVMARKRPTLILWAPLVFLQAVKAETELLIVLNHLVKALVFTTAFYIMANRVLRWNI